MALIIARGSCSTSWAGAKWSEELPTVEKGTWKVPALRALRRGEIVARIWVVRREDQHCLGSGPHRGPVRLAHRGLSLVQEALDLAQRSLAQHGVHCRIPHQTCKRRTGPSAVAGVDFPAAFP